MVYTSMTGSIAGKPCGEDMLLKAIDSALIVLVLTSVAGLFYYLRIVVALYSAAPEHAPTEMASRGGAFILVVLMILLIWFGVYPAPLLNLIRTTTAGLNVASSIASQKRVLEGNSVALFRVDIVRPDFRKELEK